MLAGMAERGMIPKLFADRHEIYETPVYGIILSTIFILLLSSQEFGQVINLLNLLYIYGQIIEFLAFVYLRYTRDDSIGNSSTRPLHRPYRIPVNLFGSCILVAMPLSFTVVILYFSSVVTLTISVFLVISCIILYYGLLFSKKKKLIEFFEDDDDDDNYDGHYQVYKP